MKRMKNTFKRIKEGAGFTLAETLLAVLILLLVSVIMTTGIPAAKNAYENVVVASNAEVLLSTTISTLRNELGTAQDVEVSEGTVITYYNSSRGAYSRIYKVDDDTIGFIRYYSKDGKSSDAAPLISKETATERLYVTYTGVEDIHNGVITIKGLSVKQESRTSDLATRPQLSIRIISG